MGKRGTTLVAPIPCPAAPTPNTTTTATTCADNLQNDIACASGGECSIAFAYAGKSKAHLVRSAGNPIISPGGMYPGLWRPVHLRTLHDIYGRQLAGLYKISRPRDSPLIGGLTFYT
jgi:hypothetical protein